MSLIRSKSLIKCPKCADSRKKSHLVTCSVYTTELGTSYRCFHCGWEELKRETIIEEDKGMDKNLNNPKPIPPGVVPFTDTSYTYYPYYVNGVHMMYVVRKGDKKEKWIRPMIWDGTEWILSTVPNLQLYRSEFLHTDDRPVIVVEGEKAADAAAKIFTKADVVSWQGGATNVQSQDWSILNGRTVILWPDNDEVGVAAMNKVADLVKSHSMSIINVSSLPDKADLADNIPMDTIIELYQNRIDIGKPILRGVIEEPTIESLFSNIEEGLSLGWKGMDEFVKLPTHGLVIIPGRTNHGKSLFMINVMANLLRQTNTACVYLSYEMPNEDIILRLIKTLNGTKFDDVGYKDDLIYKQKIQKGELPEVAEVNSYIKSNQLFITDQDVGLDELEDTLRFLHKIGKKVIIFIDYIQLVPINKYRQERYLEIKNVVEKFRQLANELKMIVMGGSQLTSGETPYQDQARESKDISFTAALILKVWNKESARVTGTFKLEADPDDKKNKIEVDYYDNTPGTFVIEVVKSRQGSLGKTIGFSCTNGCKLVEAKIKVKGDF